MMILEEAQRASERDIRKEKEHGAKTWSLGRQRAKGVRLDKNWKGVNWTRTTREGELQVVIGGLT